MFKHILKYKYFFALGVFFIISVLIITIIAIQPPSNFPNGTFDISVEQNSSVTYIANDLTKRHIISSPFLFKVLTYISRSKSGLYAGDYRFTEKEGLFHIVSRLVHGDQGLPKIKITIPEGTNVSDMAYIYLTKLTNFNAPKFYALAKIEEGYLFPDTYYFLSNTKPEAVIREMKNNFNNHISELNTKLAKSERTLREIITMASIIEEEARGLEDKQMVSGILWQRLSVGMFLQVDPPFYFITGRTGTVTYDDLKIDSPYNTYKYKGLPKGPISNPGIESIRAALTPTSSKYLFYLTGKDRVMRYAETYDGHLRNKSIYLD